MKVIDLLNKLYNNEEVPKRIKIGVCYLTLNKNKDNYIYDNSDEYYGDELIHWYDLGMKVEIIEEDKKINNLIYYNKKDFDNLDEFVEITTRDIFDKINEIIDKLNEMENE